MLRTLLITAALLTASGSALAHSDHRHGGRVVSVEPHFVVSFGSRHHDGFRVRYESGGSHYWTHTRYRPGPVIVLPPSHRVTHMHPYRDHGQYRDHDRGWKERDHDRGWKDRGDGWHGDRRDHRRDTRHDNRRHYRR